jgi:hypothetical protein
MKQGNVRKNNTFLPFLATGRWFGSFHFFLRPAITNKNSGYLPMWVGFAVSLSSKKLGGFHHPSHLRKLTEEEEVLAKKLHQQRKNDLSKEEGMRESFLYRHESDFIVSRK